MYLMHIPHAYNNPMLRRFLSNHRETHPMRSTLLRHVTFTQLVNATPIHVPVPQQTDSTTRPRVNRVVAPQPAAVPVFYHQLLPQQQRCVFHTLVPLIICFWQIRNNNVFPLQRSYSVIRAAWSWQYICPTTALHAESANAKTASNPTSTSGYYRVAFVRFWGGIVFLCLILPLELSAFFPSYSRSFHFSNLGRLAHKLNSNRPQLLYEVDVRTFTKEHLLSEAKAHTIPWATICLRYRSFLMFSARCLRIMR